MGLRQLILSKPCSKRTLQRAGVGNDVFSQHLPALELGSGMGENRHNISKRGCVLRGWQLRGKQIFSLLSRVFLLSFQEGRSLAA